MIAINDTTFYPYYGRLNAAQRRLYEQLLPGYQNARERIPVTVPASFRDTSEVISAICCDHPELFWMSEKASVTSSSATGLVSAVEPGYICAVSRIPQLRGAFDAAVRGYLAAAAGKGPLEAERVLHDKMVKDISYVHGENDQTAYGALVEHRAVCAGYTRAFQLLMQLSGIPCYYCRGEGLGKGPGGKGWGSHAWNILKLGTDHYNMDITWDDSFEQTEPGKISYRYYNCDDTKLAGNHRRAEASAFLPACRGTKYSFRNITGTEPEQEEVLQDGVTCRQTIRSAADLERYIVPEILRTAGSSTDVSFPVEGERNFAVLKEAAADILKRALSDRLYHIRYQYTDYRSGWYKFEIRITYDDPLERIFREGVTCRQVIRSAADFDRYIVPEIRRTAGRTTIVSFPVQAQGSFESLHQAMSDCIRHAVPNRGYSWGGSWRNYCGSWYWMQYKIEYK